MRIRKLIARPGFIAAMGALRKDLLMQGRSTIGFLRPTAEDLARHGIEPWPGLFFGMLSPTQPPPEDS